MDVKDICDIAAILWHQYSEADKILKLAESEKDDGSPDWEAMHEIRVESAQAQKFDAYGLYERYKNENNETIRGAYGI